MCKVDSRWEFAVWHGDLNPVLLDNPRGREVQNEGETYVYPWLFHVDVWQKPVQYCKAFILQLEKIKQNAQTEKVQGAWVRPRAL